MHHPEQLTIKQAIARAKKAIKKGNTEVALQLYNAVLQRQPNHPVAKKCLRKLKKNFLDNQPVQAQTVNPSQDQINALINLYHSGQLIKTEHVCIELLQTYSQSLIVYNILGATLQGQGKLEEAVQAFDKGIELKPNFAEAYSNRGVALKGLGKLEEAVENYNKAIGLKPDYAEAYNNRGVALKGLGKLEEAVASCDMATLFKPDYAEAYNNRGAALHDLKQLKEALENYDKAIGLKPDYAEAYNNRGIAFKDFGQLEEAVESYDKAIGLKPNYAEAYNNRGATLQDLGKLEEAVASCDKTIELNPDYVEAYNNRGAALQGLGKLEEAVKSYDKAIGLKPDYAEAYNNRGAALQALGHLKEAVESYGKAIEFKLDYAEAYRNLGILRKYELNDTHIGVMEKLFANPEQSDFDHMNLCFALAKAYEDLGEYHKSFKLIEEGNHLRKKELNYHIDTDRGMIVKIMNFFREGGLALKSVPERYPSIRPIFIVGMPRSGTSLAEQILASHTKVYGAGELETMNKLMSHILTNLSEQNVNRATEKLYQNEIKTIHDVYLGALTALNVPEKIITDKMPLNFRWIGFILSAFPGAKIINLNRDPRATCWSIYKHYFTNKGNGYAYSMDDLLAFYRLYIDLMSFWHQQFPNNIYDLCYEDLTENQEKETRRLLSFCDLELEETCLNFHKTKRTVKTASAVQVRKKLYRGSSDAWRKYEDHLWPMVKALGY